MKKKIMAALLCGAMMCSLSACRESERVAYKFHYEVNFLPEMIIPVTVTSHD